MLTCNLLFVYNFISDTFSIKRSTSGWKVGGREGMGGREGREGKWQGGKENQYGKGEMCGEGGVSKKKVGRRKEREVVGGERRECT